MLASRGAARRCGGVPVRPQHSRRASAIAASAAPDAMWVGAAGAASGPAASWSGLGTRARCERDVGRRACGRASGPLQPGGDKGMRCGQPASRVLSGRASRPYMRVWDQVRGGQLEDWST